jgi:hypothetical protein
MKVLCILYFQDCHKEIDEGLTLNLYQEASLLKTISIPKFNKEEFKKIEQELEKMPFKEKLIKIFGEPDEDIE